MADEVAGAGAPDPGVEVLDDLPVAVFVLDASGHPAYANRHASELLGVDIVRDTAAHMLADTYRACVAGTDEPYPTERMPVVRALAGETTHVHDMEIVRPERRVPLDVWAAPVVDDGGGVTHAVALFREADVASIGDVGLRVAFRDAPIGMALLDPCGRFLEVNREMTRLLGRSEHEVRGLTFRDVTHPDDLAAEEELMAELLAGERESYQIEKRYCRPGGEARWVVLSRSLVRDRHGAARHFVTHVEDVTERRQELAALVHQALHDPLTGLANRTLLLDRVQHALNRLSRQPGLHAVLYFDLDRLKAINDDHGHVIGDEALVAFASVLQAALRPTDTAARLGGDEFVVFCEDIGEVAEAQRILDRIQHALDGLTVGDTALRVLASAGLAVTESPEESALELLHRADLAMYAVKASRTR